MTSFPASPHIQKGAIVGLDPEKPLASVVIFQYNPEKLTRTLTPQTASGEAQGEALRLKGPPAEEITIEVDVDAADQLERADGLATTLGIHPTLASLEMLLYPRSAFVMANEMLAAGGIIEILPVAAPLTLFIWGVKRIVPVRIKTFSITEEAFDTSLNPIRAKVNLVLRVLTYQDLGMASVGGALFFAHQAIKEAMATIGGVGNVAGALSGNVSIG